MKDIEIVNQILQDVQKKTDTNILTSSQKQKTVTARYMFMALAYRYTRCTLNFIGAKAGRDHSTVIYALDTLDNRLFYEKDMAIIYAELREQYDECFDPKVRALKETKIKNENRHKKKLIRRINAMSRQELKQLDFLLTQ